MARMIVQHLHTDVSGKKPSPDNIMNGELAINYATNGETLYIKNSDKEIAEFKDNKYYQKQLSEKADKTYVDNSIAENATEILVNTTWSELKALRDAGSLVPGQQYRITDYTCTTVKDGTKSAGHMFDIIVISDSENKLNEEARAALHADDTYFANCDLNAWKLWYCLDNDTARFHWADSTNGKGVIYRMIDEFKNDVPYDFKNIQFYRQWNPSKELWSTILGSDTSIPCYTFSSTGSSSTTSFTDYSLSASNDVYSNVIKGYIISNKQYLNNICFFGNNCYGNTFGSDCFRNTFGSDCYYNTFGKYCYDNTFGSDCYYNTFGNSCSDNSVDYSCRVNSFGNSCSDNSVGHNCKYNSFGNNNDYNTLGKGCDANSFGNNCYDNYIGWDCSYNSFGNNCYDNYIGDDCSYNSFGNYCIRIKFAADSSASTEYRYYKNNHFGDGCQHILFKDAETASLSAQVRNYKFAQGLKGTEDTYLTIDGVKNRDYETKVAKNSKGEVKVYCEADLIL